MMERRDFIRGLVVSALAAALPLPVGLAEAIDLPGGEWLWVKSYRYVDNEHMIVGEFGSYGGVRFIETAAINDAVGNLK